MTSVQVGDVFTRWTVIGPVEHDRFKKARHLCRCECGTVRVIERIKLIRQATRSCGCGAAALISAANRTHGHTLGGKRTRQYLQWEHQRAYHREPRDFVTWLREVAA